jgi:hypothetical protein
LRQRERRAWASEGQKRSPLPEALSDDDDQVDWKLIRGVRPKKQRGLLKSENPSLMVLPLVKAQA